MRSVWGKKKCVCLCCLPVYSLRGQRSTFSKGSWSRSCCSPTCSRRWTGPPPRPGPCGQPCVELPGFRRWWKSGPTCWTLPLGCLSLWSFGLCSFGGCSPPRDCNSSPPRTPPDGSWMDPLKHLQQWNRQMKNQRTLFCHTEGLNDSLSLTLSSICIVFKIIDKDGREWVSEVLNISGEDANQ